MPLSLLYQVAGTSIIVIGLLISSLLPGLSNIWISLLLVGIMLLLLGRWMLEEK
ncbi:hypothetical protein OsccyDRAFT_3009 [Leptolyngbyaceae cyanobacterium JSC-12]|nr:hypothetical protein OsccyDRAFT_3009 [Leptolyngbyaceae cyanobacterium JSC-12]